jgi:hypothetical protein
MLNQITYTFPNSTPDSQNFFDQLIELLAEIPNAEVQESTNNLTFTPSQPLGALPKTIFTHSNIPFPLLTLGDHQDLSLNADNLHINPSAAMSYQADSKNFDQVLSKQDSLGEYFELHAASTTIYRLSINELAKRLKGHMVRIDHTGVNVPSALISREAWRRFISNVARHANLYKYPTTDVWPFILPATSEEYEAGITQFPVGREPKLELVYDTYSQVPTIQIDIETDLTRPEIERLFPAPYGISFPDLADFFRTVYIHHEWPGLNIRFDIRFKNDQPGDWETGNWLVKDGGRIKPGN